MKPWPALNLQSVCAFAIVLAIAANLLAFPNVDNAWLLIAAERVMSGEILHRDILETNPPLIVYLYLVPVWLAKTLPVSAADALVLFGFCAALLSVALARRFNTAFPALNLWLALLLLVLVGRHFGQREHWLLLFAAPYLLSMLPGNRPTLALGLWAALGVALKPYFLLIIAAAAIMRAVQQRRMAALLLPANIGMGIMLSAYGAYLVWLNPHYVTNVVPVLLEQYSGYDNALSRLLAELSYHVLFYQAPAWLLLWRGRSLLTQAQLEALRLGIAVHASCLLVVLMQQKGFSYHYLPSHMVGLMLCGSVIALSWGKRSLREAAWLSVAACALAAFVAGAQFVKIASRQWDAYETTLQKEIGNHSPRIMLLTFDLVAYSGLIDTRAKICGRYGQIWPLPGYYNLAPKLPTGEAVYRTPAIMSEGEREVFDAVVDDFLTCQPDWVIVTQRIYYHKGKNPFRFDFLSYFTQNEAFDKAWANYRERARIPYDESLDIIYERIP